MTVVYDGWLSLIHILVAPYGADKTKKLLRGPRYKALENPIETLYRVRYFDLDMNGLSLIHI